MSILIKGMEMPKNCMLCSFCVEEADPANGEMCLVTGKLMPPCNHERLDDCPLIEVPEPHGRLGDLDELEQMFVDIDNAPYSVFDGEEYFYSAEDAAQIIRLTPTVIPAEEGE